LRTAELTNYYSTDKFLKLARLRDNLSNVVSSLIDKRFAERENNSFVEYKDFVKLLVEKTEVTKKFESYFTLFWYSSLPCYDIKGLTSEAKGETAILKTCSWKGSPVPCSSVFKKVVTDQGMCCAFNKDSAEEIFQESRFTKTVRQLELADEMHSFDNSGGIIFFSYNYSFKT
jgi:hypothetical protein